MAASADELSWFPLGWDHPSPDHRGARPDQFFRIADGCLEMDPLPPEGQPWCRIPISRVVGWRCHGTTIAVLYRYAEHGRTLHSVKFEMKTLHRCVECAAVVASLITVLGDNCNDDANFV